MCNRWRKRKRHAKCFHAISTFKMLIFTHLNLCVDFVRAQVKHASNSPNLSVQTWLGVVIANVTNLRRGQCEGNGTFECTFLLKNLCKLAEKSCSRAYAF